MRHNAPHDQNPWMCAAIVATGAFVAAMLLGSTGGLQAAITQPRYYAHDAVEDQYGVIAPWYSGLNGQCDLRVRVAAETMKRYPWTNTSRAVAALPEYMFNGCWNITGDGTIAAGPLSNWDCGDMAGQAAFVLESLVAYYAYSGDPAAIAHISLQANKLIDYSQTDSGSSWPNCVITNPVYGIPYGRCDPRGWIQLDFLSDLGLSFLKAYQVTGNTRFFETARHWADLLAANRKNEPGSSPWNRYAITNTTLWSNKQTGGVVFILRFLDELIKLGYTGENNSIVAARDAGREYLKNVLLPAWTVHDTWGRNYNDNEAAYQNGKVTFITALYMMENKDYFPNWRNDVRNILSLYINNTCVNQDSNGEVFSGAWAYPESLGCCGRSLWYEPLYFASVYARYAVEAASEWSREMARRQELLATYDIHETGVSEDNIDGGVIVCGGWFKLAVPASLDYVLAAMGWMPAEFGASRENHIMRTTSVVTSVVYAKGSVTYSTFDAPVGSVDVLRLAFVPASVTAGGLALPLRTNLSANGYTTRTLGNGDCIVSLRHDGQNNIAVVGPDPQSNVGDAALSYEGGWSVVSEPGAYGGACHVTAVSGSAVRYTFGGNQVRVIGSVATDGGLADVYLDGVKQLVGIDCWNPSPRHRQVLYYKNGLTNSQHELKIVVKGQANPVSVGNRVYVDAVQWSNATGSGGFGEGGGPTDTQRMVFGYTGRQDIVDSAGNTWRPGTEFVVRLGAADAVSRSWWTTPWDAISGTADPELYRYGVHGRELIINVTVGPGTYHVRLKLAATRIADTRSNFMDIDIAGSRVVSGLDVAATAGGANRAVDLVFNGITPRNGVVDVKLHGGPPDDPSAQAFVQAVEVGPGDGGTGATPITVSEGNCLLNSGFDQGCPSRIGSQDPTGTQYGWSWLLGAGACLRSEQNTGLSPRYARSAPDALQECAELPGSQSSLAYQVVSARPNTSYRAGAFVRGIGGFGASPGDSAGVWVKELAADNSIVLDHGKLAITSADDNWIRRELTFLTRPNTAKIWYGLHTSIGCTSDAGRVVFDDCYLQLPSTLTGTVTRGGFALPGVAVTIGDKTTYTGANGTYIFPQLSAAAVTVSFIKAGCRTTSRTVVLAPGANALDMEMSDSLLVNPGFEDGVTIYSGTGSGGGNGWHYAMTYGDNAIRPESFYTSGVGFAGPFAPEYHSGSQAVRFRTSAGGGAGVIYQDVDALPNVDYQASTWVRAYGTFGGDPTDKAGIWIEELDAAGNVVRDDGQAVVTAANDDYELKSLDFTSTTATAKIRFKLISVVVEYYAAAAVTYDDCDLRQRGAATLSGTVTDGGVPVKGAKVSAQGKSATTSHDGRYILSGIGSVACIVTCSAEGRGSISRAVTLLPTSNTLDIELMPQEPVKHLANPGFELGVANNNTQGTFESFGWTYRLTNNSQGLPPAVRAESYYVGDLFSPTFHSGFEAVRFRCSDGGGFGEIWQDISVRPGAEYVASTFVRTYSNGFGFGANPGDIAGLKILALDGSGNPVGDSIAEQYISAANSAYQQLTVSFVVPAGVTKVRYELYANTSSNWASGAVAWDDCDLEQYASCARISDVKRSGANTAVLVADKVVTAAFGGFFYIEEADRSSGMKVIGAASAGDVVSIRGRVETISGEKTLLAQSSGISAAPGGAIPGALGLSNRHAGSGAAIGLLVTVWGRIVSVDPLNEYFTVTDGSDQSLKIYGYAPSDSGYVKVTGTLGCEMVGTDRLVVVHAVSVGLVG